MIDTHSERILIVDFGSQVTQLIARRVRESGVYCEIQPFQSVNSESIRAFRPKGLILSGGPASVHKIETPRAAEIIFDGSLGVQVDPCTKSDRSPRLFGVGRAVATKSKHLT